MNKNETKNQLTTLQKRLLKGWVGECVLAARGVQQFVNSVRGMSVLYCKADNVTRDMMVECPEFARLKMLDTEIGGKMRMIANGSMSPWLLLTPDRMKAKKYISQMPADEQERLLSGHSVETVAVYNPRTRSVVNKQVKDLTESEAAVVIGGGLKTPVEQRAVYERIESDTADLLKQRAVKVPEKVVEYDRATDSVRVYASGRWVLMTGALLKKALNEYTIGHDKLRGAL